MPDNQVPNPTPTPAPTPVPSPTPEPSPAPEERFVPAARFDAVVGQKYEAIRKAERPGGPHARASKVALRSTNKRVRRSRRSRSRRPGLSRRTLRVRVRLRRPLVRLSLDRLADIRARQMRFNERCNDSVATGRKAYADFDAKVDDLRKVAPTVDAQGRPMLPETLVSAALATGRAHEVLYALGSDQSEADRIMSIGDPTSQAVAVAQYAAGLKKADDEGGTTEPPAKRTN